MHQELERLVFYPNPFRQGFGFLWGIAMQHCHPQILPTRDPLAKLAIQHLNQRLMRPRQAHRLN